jgi:hypothetical protein
VRSRYPIVMLLAASLAITGCGGAPVPPATPPPAMEEHKYNELPAECFPGYRHLVDEFARPMINQLDDVRVNSLIDSRPARAIVPPYKEADVSDCSASFFRYDDLPPGSPRQRSVNVELQIFRNDFPHLGTTEQQVQSLYRITMSKLDLDVQAHELALGDEGASWFDDSSREPLRLGHALVRDGNLWVNVTADGTDVGPDGQNRSIPADEAEAAAVKLAAAALASVQQ